MTDERTLRAPLLRLGQHGERPAVIAFGKRGMESLSFAELADRTQRLAGGLLSAGASRGEVVAILGDNRPEWILAALALMLAGAVAAPLDVRLGRDMLADELRRSGARRLFTTSDLLDKVREALGSDRELEVYLLDAEQDGPEGRSWRSLLGQPGNRMPELSEDDTAVLFFTSGTTGTPKGVPLSHRNLLSNLRGLLDTGLITPRERALLPLPLHHVYPFVVGMLAPLIGGATVVLPAGISGPEIQRALRDGAVTAVIGIPRLLEALLAAIERRLSKVGKLAAAAFQALLGLSVWLRRRLGWRIGRLLFGPLRRAVAPDLRFFASGGAPLDPDVAWALEGLGWEVLSGYGLTETSPIISFTSRERNRIGTVGHPLPSVELRIDDPDETGYGQILVRGPNVFAGYKDDPGTTARAFTADGWFRTGDLGCVDDEGYLRIGARINETIVLAGGKKVFPEEVEAVYLKSGLFSEMAVLEREGKLVALVVPDMARLRETGTPDIGEAVAKELRRLAEHLPRHQRVSDFAVTRIPLPRTTLRKLRRHLLPELYDKAKAGADRPAEGEELSPEDRDLLQAETARRAWEWLKARFPSKPVTMDADLQLDLGIDSLDWVSITLELQDEVGVRLSENAVTGAATVRDLLQVILAASEAGGAAQEPGTLTPEQQRWLEPPGPLVEALGLLLFALNWLVLRVLFRLRASGRERLPASGPFILAPNHASFLDPFALGAALPLALVRRTYWAGFTAYLFQHAPQRLFSRIARVLPIDPARAPASSLALGIETVRRGRILVWFPEGARSPTGELQALMPGIGRIIAETAVPVVPVHIAGTFEAWPRGRRFPRLRPIRVRFGEPFRPGKEMVARGGGEAAAQLNAALRDRLLRLAEEHAATGSDGTRR